MVVQESKSNYTHLPQLFSLKELDHMTALPIAVIAQYGVYHRLGEGDRLLSNLDPHHHDFVLGYAFVLCQQGHVGCQCMRSEKFYYFILHDPREGLWPVDDSVSKGYGDELVSFLGGNLRVALHSHVLIRRRCYQQHLSY